MKIRTTRVRLLAGISSFVLVAMVAIFPPRKRAWHKKLRTTNLFTSHGRIYTNDPAHPWAEAMAVSDGKISCMHRQDGPRSPRLRGQARKAWRRSQLKGQFVMPGFNDAHVHLGSAAADETCRPAGGRAFRGRNCRSASPPPLRSTKKANGSLAEAGITRSGPEKNFPQSPAARCRRSQESRYPSHTSPATWPSRIRSRSKARRSIKPLPIRRAARSNTMRLASRR